MNTINNINAILNGKKASKSHNSFSKKLVASTAFSEEFEKAWKSLPENMRLYMNLMYVEGMTAEKIAKLTDTSVGMVRNRIFEGRNTLVAKLRLAFPKQPSKALNKPHFPKACGTSDSGSIRHLNLITNMIGNLSYEEYLSNLGKEGYPFAYQGIIPFACGNILPARDRIIVEQRYGLGMTQKNIGLTHNLSQSHVSLLLKKAEAKIADYCQKNPDVLLGRIGEPKTVEVPVTVEVPAPAVEKKGWPFNLLDELALDKMNKPAENAETARRLAAALANVPAAERNIVSFVFREGRELNDENEAVLLARAVRILRSRLFWNLISDSRANKIMLIQCKKSFKELCPVEFLKLGNEAYNELAKYDSYRLVDDLLHFRNYQEVTEKFGRKFGNQIVTALVKFGVNADHLLKKSSVRTFKD